MSSPCCEKAICIAARANIKGDGHQYCGNFFHSFWTESILKSYENVCKNHDYCHVKISEAHNKILKGYLCYKRITSQNVSSEAQLCSILKMFKFLYF